jgi:mannose-6-phosphate isomerase-like protein (cupin superfamily)
VLPALGKAADRACDRHHGDRNRTLPVGRVARRADELDVPVAEQALIGRVRQVRAQRRATRAAAKDRERRVAQSRASASSRSSRHQTLLANEPTTYTDAIWPSSGAPSSSAKLASTGAPGSSGRRRRCDLLSHRIAAVPFTLRNLREDLEDLGSNFDGAPDLEFRMASKALELEQSGLSYQRIPPDYRFPYGHTHKEQEEVYVVVGGSGRMKLDDEIVEVKEWDVVRVPPGTWRGYESGPEGLEILVFGAPNLGENPREDVEGQRDWWAD